MKKVLVVIVNYGNSQIHFLDKVVESFKSFKNYDLDIVIHSNIPLEYEGVEIIIKDHMNDWNTFPWETRKTIYDRKDEYDEVATAKNKVIIATYGVAAVGINIPRIFNLVLIEPGKSFVRVIQSIGRGIRKAEDKDFVQIWDITSTAKFAKRHLTARKKWYREANYPFTIEKVDY